MEVPADLLRQSDRRRVRLSESDSAGARHVPAEHRLQGHRRRQHDHLSDGAECSALRRREAGVEQPDSGGPDRKGSDQQHRYRPVRDRRHQGSAAADRHLRAATRSWAFTRSSTISGRTRRPRSRTAPFEYEITKNGSEKPVLDYTEEVTRSAGRVGAAGDGGEAAAAPVAGAGAVYAEDEGDGQEPQPDADPDRHFYGKVGERRDEGIRPR